ncbi:MAG TPA: DNA-3-methyladenine glycosylase [Candidatus Saccharimonadia bacterium]|nr:DNA-3-methyladenine glycosylase [Candidatus Saccharimonadia bacterium]
MIQPDYTSYSWLEQDSTAVAPLLLGWELVTHIGTVTTAGRITETEAYMGSRDPASHAFRGLTNRTAPMFEDGGFIYVYLSYGIHACVNIVTGPKGTASAVLIRALQPTRGQSTMITRRRSSNLLNLCDGPGKLTQALGIGLGLSGTHLGPTVSLKPPQIPLSTNQIVTTTRVGISKATDKPWRFLIKNNLFIPHQQRE